MFIFNPTAEHIDTMHASSLYSFEPGETKPIDDKAAAAHILNTFSRRGLVSLEYGDDTNKGTGGKTIKENKAEFGRKANYNFTRGMVIAHNQINEANKATHKAFVSPTKQVEGYAKRHSLKLVKPYEVDDILQQEQNKLAAENRELKGMIKDQGLQIGELLEAIKANGTTPPPVKTPEENEAVRILAERTENVGKVNAYVRKDYFLKWLNANIEKVKLWPEEDKLVVRKKYTELVGGEANI